MELPIYELIINEKEGDDAEVSAIALVDSPAIKQNYLVFSEQFIEPSKGEHQNDFLPRCISYVVNEGKDSAQAVAICNSIWEQHFAANKVSFDYDDTLSTSRGKELAKKKMEEGNTIYIISARSDASAMYAIADEIGIPHSRVYATGSNKAKVEKIKELGINKHYDNNADVVKELGGVGQKFMQYSFAIENEDEHIITGALMIPNQLIFRENPKFGKHYVQFSANTIRQIAIKFSKKGYQKNVNIMHDEALQVEGLTMFESFISNAKRGVKPMAAFSDLPDGTWFGSFYVENPGVWKLIKENKVRGFSVEGMFDYVSPQTKEEQKLAELKNILNSFQ